MAPDEALSVDDLVTGATAEALGEGVIPNAAVLIVETIGEEGKGLRFVRSHDCTSWQAIGMLRSALLHLEAEDLAAWGDEDSEQD